MFTKNEFPTIILISLIIAFSITLLSGLSEFFYALLAVFVLISLNVVTKKIVAYGFEINLETNLWEFKRYGYKPTHKFKKKFPAGLFLPLISKIIFFSLNGFVWMASLVFSVNAKTERVAKRHGYYSFAQVSENHIAYIAASGIFVNLILALAGYLAGFPDFAKYNIWFAFFNLIPISNLDGNKIFFGSYLLWGVLAVITLASLLGTIIIS